MIERDATPFELAVALRDRISLYPRDGVSLTGLELRGLRELAEGLVDTIGTQEAVRAVIVAEINAELEAIEPSRGMIPVLGTVS